MINVFTYHLNRLILANGHMDRELYLNPDLSDVRGFKTGRMVDVAVTGTRNFDSFSESFIRRGFVVKVRGVVVWVRIQHPYGG